jgi:Immunoglobulin-like domain of bacterial spore germination
VESPLPFAEVTSPLEISGTANTFEATVLVNVTDGDGLIVYDDHTTATSGSGTRGTFDLTATFDVPQPGVGEVIVFEESAQDGSRVNIVEVPVRIS